MLEATQSAPAFACTLTQLKDHGQNRLTGDAAFARRTPVPVNRQNYMAALAIRVQSIFVYEIRRSATLETTGEA